jgi:Protein of unknown function (DUF2934)
MQSRKASNSKKTTKNANEAIVNEKNVAAAAEIAAKPSASRSSRSKKETSIEATPAKNHRKTAIGAAAIPASESSLVANTLPEIPDAPKAMAAAAGSDSASVDTAIIDPVGVVAAPETSTGPQYSHEDVAKLAYSYWIARGHSHGAADEDWLRAEAELAGKR